MRFDTFYEDTIKSLVVEHSLPQDIFYYPNVTADPHTQSLLLKKDGIKPILNQLIKRHILSDIEEINNVDINKPRRVEDYVIVGNCLRAFQTTKENVPVEVVVYYNVDNFTDMSHSRLTALLSRINGRYLPGSRRKIFYYLRHTPIELNDYPAVYHPFMEKWLKEPSTFNINL